MTPIVRRIRLGITNCYLLGHNHHWILVDAGIRGWSGRFFRKLAVWGCRPSDLRLIVITHAHFDHVGSLAAIRRRCDCPVAVHRIEASWLSEGRILLPPGIRPHTRALIGLANRHPDLVRRWYRFESVKAEILVEKELSLAPFGVAARVLHTPGHTPGSISVLTEAGDAMVGDLAVNYIPFGLASVAPPFGDSVAMIRRQWRRLRDLGTRRIHPGHGWSFGASALRTSHRTIHSRNVSSPF